MQSLQQLTETQRKRVVLFYICGTGTNWKNFIIFDLSILKLTPLPVIAHDSMMLKNIADFPVDSIIQLYTQFEKQIFITFDKEESFSEEIQEILQKSKVLHLYDGDGELFGWSWAKKTKLMKRIELGKEYESISENGIPDLREQLQE